MTIQRMTSTGLAAVTRQRLTSAGLVGDVRYRDSSSGLVEVIGGGGSGTTGTLSNIKGFTIGTYSDWGNYQSNGAALGLGGLGNGAYWSTAQTLPALIQSYGGNSVALMSQYYYSNFGSTDLATSGTTANSTTYAALTMTAITQMTSIIKGLGMKVILKPHNGIGDSWIQSTWIPLGQFSISGWGGYSNVASYNTGSSTISCSGSVMNLTSPPFGPAVTPGWRVVCLNTNGYWGNNPNDIPNSYYTTPYATGPALACSTVGSVLSSNSFTLANAAGTAIHPNANSSGAVMVVVIPPDVVGGPAQAAFDAWQTVLLNSIAAAEAGGGCDACDMATEHELWTRYFPVMWRNLISNIRAQYPNVLLFVQASEGLDYGGDCNFIDALDAIGMSAYPSVGNSGGGDNQTSVNNLWVGSVTGTNPSGSINAAAFSAAWGGKQLIFGELGCCSVYNACYYPGSYGGQASMFNPATEQTMWWNGFWNACGGQSWFGGFMWWTGFTAYNWANSSPPGQYSDEASYEPKLTTTNAMKVSLL